MIPPGRERDELIAAGDQLVESAQQHWDAMAQAVADWRAAVALALGDIGAAMAARYGASSEGERA